MTDTQPASSLKLTPKGPIRNGPDAPLAANALASSPKAPSTPKPNDQLSIIINGAPRLDGNPAAPPDDGICLVQVFLQNTHVGTGSGSMIESDVLLTAAHVLRDPPSFDAAGVWPAFDTNKNPNPSNRTIAAHCFHPTLDLLVFVLGPGPGQPLTMNPNTPAQGTSVRLSGYGSNYPGGQLRLSYGTGAVSGVSASEIEYKIDTGPGDSGGAVLSGTGQLVAVHTDAATDPMLGNSGIPLTAAVIGDIHQMIAAARSSIQ